MTSKKWSRKTVVNIGITLANRFNEEDLRNLAFDLDIDYGDLEGRTQDTKARSLVQYMDHRDRLDELINVGKQSRTDVDWDGLIVLIEAEEVDEGKDEIFSATDFVDNQLPTYIEDSTQTISSWPDLQFDSRPESSQDFQGAAYSHPISKISEIEIGTSEFFGRQSEISQLEEILANSQYQLVSLIGPGGIGKTRLAVATANKMIAHFKDGIAFVSLVGIDPRDKEDSESLLIDQIANSIGYTFSAQRPPEELLIEFLSRRELLLVLDNFEQMKDSTPFLQKLIQQAQGIKLIVTSRIRLDLSEERPVYVTGLTCPSNLNNGVSLLDFDATALFCERANQIQPSFDSKGQQEGIIEICNLVEGSPLGIELSAKWVRTLSCKAISEKISNNIDLLETSSSAVEERHRTLRAVLDQSWHLLTSTEQQLYSRVAYFRGGFTLNAAEEVAKANLLDLRGLVEKSILRRSENGRYTLHELVRQYGENKLVSNPAELFQIKVAHHNYFCTYLRDRRPTEGQFSDSTIVAELDENVDNLRLAWSSILETKNVDLIDLYIDVLFVYYQRKSWFGEIESVARLALTIESKSILRSAHLTHWIGIAKYDLGQIESSKKYIIEALSLLNHPVPASTINLSAMFIKELSIQVLARLTFLPAKDKSQTKTDYLLIMKEVAQLYNRLGIIYLFWGDQVQILYSWICALNAAEKSQSFAELAKSYSQISLIVGQIPPLRFLAKLYDELEGKYFDSVNDLFHRFWIHSINMIKKLNMGEWDKALKQLEQAKIIAKKVAYTRGSNEIFQVEAHIIEFKGDLDQAVTLWKESVRSSKDYGDRHLEFWAYAGLARLALKQKTNAEIKSIYSLLRDKEDFLPTKPQPEQIAFYGLLAQLEWRLGKKDQARRSTEMTLKAIKADGAPSSFFILQAYSGPIMICLQDWETELESSKNTFGKKHAKVALKMVQRYARAFQFAKPRTLLFEGLFHILNENPKKAYQVWENGLSAATEIKMPYDEGLIHYEMGRHLEPGTPQRDKHLSKAVHIFSDLGAKFDLKRAENAMGN